MSLAISEDVKFDCSKIQLFYEPKPDAEVKSVNRYKNANYE